ncbi:MAG: protein phosphatase 2C domain-containing protein [Actinomycetota bacterium]|nr:protein phosphatase 2C domain-containing protein [Actinomycetota bacterium]
MTEPGSALPHAGTAPSVAGPTVSFGFNLGKIPDQGEDSDPILRIGRDLALLAVFDGMGGAGGTVYETPDGPRTGAYLASRVARDVIEQRMVELLEPDWYLDGRATAQDLRRSMKAALVERLAELKAPPSGLRSRLLRALPTTMALTALQRLQPGGGRWACHVLWAGDSRAYVFDADGAHQLTTDDLRDPGDAMANLRHDSVVSNAISADTEFDVRYRRVELQAPFLLVCATDGCFGYVRSPMHFEHLVLSRLRDVRSVDGWSAALQAEITATTGDDAAMSTLGVGADLAELKALFAPRIARLEDEALAPLDEAVDAVRQAELTLEALRRREIETAASVWQAYKPGYERFLHQVDEVSEEDGPPILGRTDGEPPEPEEEAPLGEEAPEPGDPEGTPTGASAAPERGPSHEEDADDERSSRGSDPS